MGEVLEAINPVHYGIEILYAMQSLLSLTLLATLLHNRLWYALPLVISVSLVYAATRHEMLAPILDHAWRFGGWLIGFLTLFFVILLLSSAWL